MRTFMQLWITILFANLHLVTPDNPYLYELRGKGEHILGHVPFDAKPGDRIAVKAEHGAEGDLRINKTILTKVLTTTPARQTTDKFAVTLTMEPQQTTDDQVTNRHHMTSPKVRGHTADHNSGTKINGRTGAIFPTAQSPELGINTSPPKDKQSSWPFVLSSKASTPKVASTNGHSTSSAHNLKTSHIKQTIVSTHMSPHPSSRPSFHHTASSMINSNFPHSTSSHSSNTLTGGHSLHPTSQTHGRLSTSVRRLVPKTNSARGHSSTGGHSTFHPTFWSHPSSLSNQLNTKLQPDTFSTQLHLASRTQSTKERRRRRHAALSNFWDPNSGAPHAAPPEQSGEPDDTPYHFVVEGTFAFKIDKELYVVVNDTSQLQEATLIIFYVYMADSEGTVVSNPLPFLIFVDHPHQDTSKFPEAPAIFAGVLVLIIVVLAFTIPLVTRAKRRKKLGKPLFKLGSHPSSADLLSQQSDMTRVESKEPNWFGNHTVYDYGEEVKREKTEFTREIKDINRHTRGKSFPPASGTASPPTQGHTNNGFRNSADGEQMEMYRKSVAF